MIMAKENNKTYDLVYISMFTVLIAICSWISIPAAVPFTLQTLGVFLAVGILGGKRGTIAVLVYILLGAIGIPVFAGFSGGIGVLTGTTGGYIVGFLASALVMWGMERAFGKGKKIQILSMLVGLLACYAVGTLWFMAVYTHQTGEVGILAVLGWCVFPFVIPDILKIALAVILSGRLKGAVRR
ncbi:hypothetical protein HMPREF0992_00040 [Lachnospiraceae bacterium 6_1_63FAA]|nr:hypothetical protein HMPREF0992_00040 [Lachnospiraceae bacterium 6_1_63FAA]